MNTSEPLQLLEMAVEPTWIDYNDHMNVGYYVVAFDRATDELIDRLGMDADYRARSGCTVFVLETHVSYLQEMHLGERMRIDVRIVDCDEKRIHFFMQMVRVGESAAAATSEIMLMHVDGASGRSAPMPAQAQQMLAQLHAAHRELPAPAQLGARIGIRRR